MNAGRFSFEVHGRSGHGLDVQLVGSSWSAGAFKASLKQGETLRFSAPLFTSSNLIAPRKCLCICAMLAGNYHASHCVSVYLNGH